MQQNVADGHWVTYETDVGPVPQGTPALCMRQGLNGSACVLFWPNPSMHTGKLDGNLWMVGDVAKCTYKVRAKQDQHARRAEALLNTIVERELHIPNLEKLATFMDVDGPENLVLDGEGEGAWKL